MDELSDLTLDPAPLEAEQPPGPQEPSKRPVLIGVVILALVAAALGYWWSHRGDAEPPTAAPAVAEAPEEPVKQAAPVVEETVALPPLATSDEFVRSAVTALSARPELAKWLLPDDLVRRLVVSVDNVAEGRAPTDHLRVLRPDHGFEAQEAGRGWVPGPSSYRRFDRLTDVITSVDPRTAAQLVRTLEPLLTEAYRELGYPDGHFLDVLGQAIVELNEVPSDVSAPRLVPRLSSYHYADQELEDLSLAQKQLLRMGPRNVQRIQAQLTAVAAELGLD